MCVRNSGTQWMFLLIENINLDNAKLRDLNDD